MNDTQLSSLRREPSPEFAGRLKASLQAAPVSAAKEPARWPFARMAASIALVGVIGALLSVPAVRASASSLLARFRVVNFVAVQIDEGRVAALRSKELDLPDLIGEHIQILQEPGAPITAVSVAQAGAATGIDVRLPAWLPPAVTLREIQYTGPGRLRVTADTTRLEQMMDFVGIHDLSVPAGLHGKVADVAVPAIVRIRYANDTGAHAEFLQARSPEVTLPDGVDLAALAEIGLRIMGLSPTDAKQFARAIDWRSTLLVPIPPEAISFKHISVNGNPGIAIERLVNNPQAKAGSRGEMVLWSADGHVFGFEGNFQPKSFLQMANSVR